MASISMVMLSNSATQKKLQHPPNAQSILHPLPIRPSKAVLPTNLKSRAKLEVQASLKEKAVTSLKSGALTTSILKPEVAEAAKPGVSPSIKNFLLSIVAGGVVLGAIIGAVIAVANFDPIKRN